MNNLLEISGDEIASLNDADLRSLIGLLCEADYRLAGFSPRGIRWGGHQDASDGGLDVIVSSESKPPKSSFIPRKDTGFQVKKPNMPRSKILEEMRPKGFLREEIKSLIRKRGAYIIISSSGSSTETALNKRIKAMHEAVVDEPDNERLYLDFLDRGRIATWVRSHPSLVLWVRNKIGKPIRGWKSYGNWANTPEGVPDEYLLDNEVRLFGGTKSGEGNKVLDGIKMLRERLLCKGASIRLIGLSGVGKTRLIQALFDERIGEHTLNPYLAYYTDISDNPTPDPISFANELILLGTSGVLIIDNCSPELHRQLTTICTKSSVNLVTIEYDIQDDLPEQTDVFRLEPASDQLIERLLEKRYSLIGEINASKIAEFACGNARVAIALANTLKQGESLSTLRDPVLFKRLFYQNHPNEDLLISAEVCSLVYSFNGDDISEGSELAFLANLADRSVKELFRDIQELMNRGLVQSRSVWRALLPHAIANRLAKQALNSIPRTTIVNAFLTSGSERLITSFTRRLGYLHDCTVAVEITRDWLKPDGWLGKTDCNFNSFGLSVFKNLAPIFPEATLSMIERAVKNNSEDTSVLRNDNHRQEFIWLLQHLACEPDLFERSVKILYKYAFLEKPDITDGGSARSTLKTLFCIILSGTHAPFQLRANLINELVKSDIPNEANLGIELLASALQTNHFHTLNTANFGARSRDFGYHPKSAQDICDWYEGFVDICNQVALSDKSIAAEAKKVFANNLRGLWVVGIANGQSLLEKLEDSVTRIHRKQAWNDGWVAVKEILRYDGKRMSKKDLEKIKELEKSLRPTSLLERARTFALTGERLNFDLEDDYDEADDVSSHRERIQRITREIGAEVILDINLFKTILPELLTIDNIRLKAFGAGLADGCKDRQKVWQMLYVQLKKTPPEQQHIAVLLGFLSSCAENDPDFSNTILDGLIDDELLGKWFPFFQMTSTVDADGIMRLHKSLDSNRVRIDRFRILKWHSYSEAIDDDTLAILVKKISEKEGGIFVAVDILSMRFRMSLEKPIDHLPKLVSVGQEVLENFPYDTELIRNSNLDYELSQIANICLGVNDSAEAAGIICNTLDKGFRKHRFTTINYPYLLNSLARIHPYTFLDIFIGVEKGIIFPRSRLSNLDSEDNPVNQIPENVLLDWCERAPEIRYIQLVPSLQTYLITRGTGELSWQPIIFSIIERAPNIEEVLSSLRYTLDPMSWTGSYADALEKRLVLFTSLNDHPNPIVRSWSKEQYIILRSAIKKERENELRDNHARFERFE